MGEGGFSEHPKMSWVYPALVSALLLMEGPDRATAEDDDPCSILPPGQPPCPIRKNSGITSATYRNQSDCQCPEGFTGEPTAERFQCMPLNCKKNSGKFRCGINAYCEGERGNCLYGFQGDPYVNCKMPCNRNTCGHNAECNFDFHKLGFTTCSCKQGFEGDPYEGCSLVPCLDDCDCPAADFEGDPAAIPFYGNDGWCHTDITYGNLSGTCELVKATREDNQRKNPGNIFYTLCKDDDSECPYYRFAGCFFVTDNSCGLDVKNICAFSPGLATKTRSRKRCPC